MMVYQHMPGFGIFWNFSLVRVHILSCVFPRIGARVGVEFGERRASFLVCEPVRFEQVSAAELPATGFAHVVLPPTFAGPRLRFFFLPLLLLLLFLVLKVFAALVIIHPGSVVMRRLSAVQQGDGVLQLHRLVVSV